MNNNNSERHFSFFQGICSIFFGSAQSRIRIYYSSLEKRSDGEAIREDFQKVGNDLRKVMKKEAKQHSLELKECDY